MQGRLFNNLFVELDPAAANGGGSWRGLSNNMVQAYSTDVLPFFHGKLSSIERPVYLDIGANTGAFTLLAAHVPDARCVAFEPNPLLAESLKRSIQLNELGTQVSVIEVALGKAPGYATLHILPDAHGHSRLDRGFVARTDEQIVEVSVTTLDKVMHSILLDRIDFIKLDVEGYELFVLQGGEATIRHHMPGLLVEWWPPNTEPFGYHPRKIDELLESWGYTKTGVSATDVWYERKE